MPAALKRTRTPSPDRLRRSLSPLTPPPPSSRRPSSSKVKLEATSSSAESPHKSKKLQLLATYASTSPFPDFARPTPIEAHEVHRLLLSQFPELATKKRKADEKNNAAGTCGGVPNVIESLIGMSRHNTSSKNSTGAKRSLDAAFGRNNFAAIADAPRERVVDAIRHGGLANKKAGVIQNLLKEIKARHGDYSLQHLASRPSKSALSDDEIMHELVSYDGVGPKTASCVLLFCLERPSFAVDTHVFRLSKMLGWVPAKSDRVLAQAHLDARIPGELKYGLHCGFVKHGRVCPACKAGPSGGGKVECVLRRWIRERGWEPEEEEGGQDAKVKVEDGVVDILKEEGAETRPRSRKRIKTEEY
ncbi:DNA glycosylase [Punctularia strigosozonata HHB-11173 SS5]|uniref:DNA glycosylase n=1 Tax=Punctularia strigosozonata (strain HHB-11173) TaxID=741275 RepID=UPI0004416DB4|nr:DNA glycosylase [Punctularia strigosozonata HHB-11173 SS5]EIN10780.1 DNA glycosylase [Punctularia strigosozonata HHB-11173 SS5]